MFQISRIVPNYFYIAKSFDGESQTGNLNADNEHQLAKALKSQNMILIRAVLEEKKGRFRFNLPLPFFGVSSTEKIMMTRNIGVMFSAGLSLVKSFDILTVQARSKKLKNALSEIRDRINKGENFSDALARYPDIFSEIFVNMVKVGEESGTLDEVFQILSLQLNKEHELKSKIKNAMVYPCIILTVMLAVGGVVVTFVLPSLNIFFQTLNVDIPLYTKILLYVGNFLSKNWYLLFLVPFLLFCIVFLTLRTKKGKIFIDAFLIRLPVISQIVKKNNSAFLIRSLSSLIASGVPLIRSLEISSKIVSNHYFQEAVVDAAKKIRKGEKLSSALRPYQNIFPLGVIDMMEVGEETGKTTLILKKLADFYEQEATNAIERLSILIEPVLIIFLGLGAALFAFSIIQPMYSSLKAINQ